MVEKNRRKASEKESPIVKTWRRSIEGALTFAENLRELKIVGSNKWALGNYRYYRDNVVNLLTVKIPGTSKLRVDFSKRLRKLPAA